MRRGISSVLRFYKGKFWKRGWLDSVSWIDERMNVDGAAEVGVGVVVIEAMGVFSEFSGAEGGEG